MSVPRGKDDIKIILAGIFGRSIDEALVSYLASINDKNDFTVALREIFAAPGNDRLIDNAADACFSKPISRRDDPIASAVQKRKKPVGKSSSVQRERYECLCEATEHKLIGNCLNCGRIVCALEGPGPCLFCKYPVEARHKKDVVQRPSNREAEARKEQLLEFDRTSAQRTKVIDDESDFFKVGNRWLTREQRDKLKALQEEIRLKKFNTKHAVTLDLESREVTEEKEDPLKDIEAKLAAIFDEGDVKTPVKKGDRSCFDVKFVPGNSMHPDIKLEELTYADGPLRVQDCEQQLMSDMGMCLSVKQPYASLLCLGIKRQEGRNWYTPHRGRLWIRAGAEPPNKQETEKIENYYRMLRGDRVQFPKSYPTGCIVGCVSVVDCVPSEEIEEDEREVDSKFVLICHDPVAVELKIPIAGQAKICKFRRVHGLITLFPSLRQNRYAIASSIEKVGGQLDKGQGVTEDD